MAFNAIDKFAPGAYGPSQNALLLLDFDGMLVSNSTGPRGQGAAAIAAKVPPWTHSQGIQVTDGRIDLRGLPFETCKDSGRFAAVVSAVRKDAAMGEKDVTFPRSLGHVSALKLPGLEEFW